MRARTLLTVKRLFQEQHALLIRITCAPILEKPGAARKCWRRRDPFPLTSALVKKLPIIWSLDFSPFLPFVIKWKTRLVLQRGNYVEQSYKATCTFQNVTYRFYHLPLRSYFPYDERNEYSVNNVSVRSWLDWRNSMTTLTQVLLYILSPGIESINIFLSYHVLRYDNHLLCCHLISLHPKGFKLCLPLYVSNKVEWTDKD